jgi:hypothetical protein
MAGTLRAWALVWAGWTALALLFGVSTSLTYVSTGRAANWSVTLARTFSEWWLWALLTPVVVRLARRFPLNRTDWRRSLVVHVLAGTATAVAKTAADRAIFALITGFWMYWLVSTLALQLVVYAGIVAAAHGLEYYGRSREREQTICPSVSPLRRAYARSARTRLTGSLKVMATVGSTAGTGAPNAAACSR